MIPSEYILAYVVVNALSVLLIVTAWRRPAAARGIFACLFFAAAVGNLVVAVGDPQIYVQLFGELAVLQVYEDFIFGFFASHTRLVVLSVAAGQLAIAAVLMLPGVVRLAGVVGAMIFLIAVCPLGVGSAFPATLLMVLALVVAARPAHRVESSEISPP